MAEDLQAGLEQPVKPPPRRSIRFVTTCLFAFVYYGILFLIFLSGIFASGWIRDVIREYEPDQAYSRGTIILYMLGGMLLSATSLTGTMLIWKRKRQGLWLFLSATVIFIMVLLFQSFVNYLSLVIHLLLSLIFLTYYRKLSTSA
ncbi:MAG: hypothetical protein FJY10_12545 [Bacteroidetes bacterium]|nr:hypothetical protein [Bacteroidota bacterium]